MPMDSLLDDLSWFPLISGLKYTNLYPIKAIVDTALSTTKERFLLYFVVTNSQITDYKMFNIISMIYFLLFMPQSTVAEYVFS